MRPDTTTLNTPAAPLQDPPAATAGLACVLLVSQPQPQPQHTLADAAMRACEPWVVLAGLLT